MPRTSRKPPPPPKPEQPNRKKQHLNELLDEALKETFPASDAAAMLEPAPNSNHADEDTDRPSNRGNKPADEDTQ